MTATLLGFLFCTAGAGFCLWRADRERKAYVPGRVWRFPYVGLALLLTTAAVTLLAHLFSLVTGAPVRGRAGLF